MLVLKCCFIGPCWPSTSCQLTLKCKRKTAKLLMSIRIAAFEYLNMCARYVRMFCKSLNINSRTRRRPDTHATHTLQRTVTAHTHTHMHSHTDSQVDSLLANCLWRRRLCWRRCCRCRCRWRFQWTWSHCAAFDLWSHRETAYLHVSVCVCMCLCVCGCVCMHIVHYFTFIQVTKQANKLNEIVIESHRLIETRFMLCSKCHHY